MKKTEPQNPYESYCYTCNVTAPVDTRTCVHCGGRLSRQRGIPAPTIPVPFSGQALDEGELDAPRRMGSVSPITVVWVLLFLAWTVFRLCA